MSWSISQDPLSSGSAGPARPSVLKHNVRNRYATFTLVCVRRQPSSHLGFPSEISCEARVSGRKFLSRPVALATKSGKAPKAVNHPDREFRRLSFDYRSRCVPLAAVVHVTGRLFSYPILDREHS
jgi:hypothetical protein